MNVFLLLSNTVSNVVLVYSYGWVGAVVATALSSFLLSLVSYLLISRVAPFSLPLREISRQSLVAALMGGVVFASGRLLTLYGIDTERFAPVIALAGIGAAVCFTVLFISSQLRTSVSENTPVRIQRWGIKSP